MSAAARLEAIVRGFRGRRVLVLADLVADEFVYGRVERISREAPVLILRHDATDVRLGGGANAVHNIRTLGGAPVAFGVLGKDAHGRALRALLREKGIPARGVAEEAGYATPVKSRILAGRAHSTKQQVVRLDRYAPLPPRSAARREVERALRALGRGPTVMPGFVNRLATVFMTKLLPRRTAIGILARRATMVGSEGQ